MKDLGGLHYFFGIEIKRDQVKRKLWINERKYVVDMLKKVGMEKCKPLNTPFSLSTILSMEQFPKIEIEKNKMAKVAYAIVIGKLMYTMVCTRLDLAHTMGIISYFMSNL